MMNNLEKKVRVRFAPSPTGFLHVGGLRTALYNYLFAKKNGGEFLLRIEDTDQKRFVEGAKESLLSTLKNMNLEWDNEKIYVQSENLETYKKYAEQLVAEGKAYYCFCEPERLEEVRAQKQAEKKPPMYDRYCLTNLSQAEINQKLKENCPATIRLKVPKDEIIEFKDVVRGKVSFSTNTIDDQVLLKSDGFPTYHLANVIDDHLMNITHVIRGEEWLPSTPKHILLYKAFGWEMPKFAHLPLLLNPDKSKLSKRQGDVAVEDYLQKGYLKEALTNFVALLGWNPGEGSVQEIFSLEELVEKFELEKVHKAGAVFELKKLDWLNAQYIKKLSIEELFLACIPFLKEKEFFLEANAEKRNDAYVKKVLVVERERLSKFSQVCEENRFFFTEIDYPTELLSWKELTAKELIESLEESTKALTEIAENDWELTQIEEKLLAAAGEKRGDLLWPLRVALTGAQKSPSPFEIAWVLGKKESLQRIAKAIEKLQEA